MKAPDSVKFAQRLFILNAAIWLIFFVISLTKTGTDPSQPITTLVIAVLMLGNAAVLLFAALGMGRQYRKYFYFGIAALMVNIILAITDHFGLMDFLILAFDFLLLSLLIATRSRYGPAR